MVYIKPTTYRRKGKIIHRKGYTRRVTAKQRAAARRNIKKALRKWKSMSHRARARAMPSQPKPKGKRPRWKGKKGR